MGDDWQLDETFEVMVVDNVDSWQPKLQRYPGRPALLAGHAGGAVAAVEPQPADVGDCYRAAIAALVNFDVNYVPHFAYERNVHEWQAGERLPFLELQLARTWLIDTLDLDLALLRREDMDAAGVPYIATMRSLAGPWHHAVVMQRGEVVCDPANDGGYGLEQLVPECAVEAIVLPYEPDPARLVAMMRANDVGVES